MEKWMRLWTLSPKYLDTPGLNGLWKEACLAKSRLLAQGGGYYNHSEMVRFKAHPQPIQAINYYLGYVWLESRQRDFKYSRDKFELTGEHCKGSIVVSLGQLEFEKQHLCAKLAERKGKRLTVGQLTELHPLFCLEKL